MRSISLGPPEIEKGEHWWPDAIVQDIGRSIRWSSAEECWWLAPNTQKGLYKIEYVKALAMHSTPRWDDVSRLSILESESLWAEQQDS